ncbi:DUF6221 family protein [Nonomuraea sp. NPDC004702]
MAADDLLSWLRSTIESDLARARNEGPDWYSVEDLTDYDYCMDAGRAEYIVRHGPRDTIARCEAELRLIALCESTTEYALKRPQGNSAYLVAHQSDILVRLLASGYRHRPGFNPEWLSE